MSINNTDDNTSSGKGEDTLDLPTYDDVIEAARRLKGISHVTPVVTSRTLNESLGISIFLKCEQLQRMGAFKFRGAYNALSRSTGGGVCTFSSGNHAQAIALSARLLNRSATIIMPNDAPKSKVSATKGYGGNIIFYDRYTQDREALARDYIAQQQQYHGIAFSFVPPYNHKDVIAGQGTAGKELMETVQTDHGIQALDYLFVCVGGGGLISGCSLAANALAPNCKVIGVEPEAGNDAQQSLEQGKIIKIDTPSTIADGAQTQAIGNLTFAIMKRRVDHIITVSDDELIHEMRYLGERLKMIIEPTGCLGLAGLRKMVSMDQIPSGANCGVILSGGNVDMDRYCDLVSSSS
mmetsp:Transcript_1313/g.1973  ORF Transcript_1313/g.1973 Transcript_1313/m.1973 type:complete len:351 (+) Transcript_1313:117-1169(+)